MRRERVVRVRLVALAIGLVLEPIRHDRTYERVLDYNLSVTERFAIACCLRLVISIFEVELA